MRDIMKHFISGWVEKERGDNDRGKDDQWMDSDEECLICVPALPLITDLAHITYPAFHENRTVKSRRLWIQK